MSQSKPDESLALSNTSNLSSDSSLSFAPTPTADTPAEQTKLGWRYEKGVEVPKDEIKAEAKDALDQTPLPPADQKALSEISEGLQNNKTADEQYFEQQLLLAQSDNVDAQFNLGVCYEEGRGIAKNDDKAVEWYEKAATWKRRRLITSTQALFGRPFPVGLPLPHFKFQGNRVDLKKHAARAALFIAAEKGYVSTVLKLVAQGVLVNLYISNGFEATPLHFAAQMWNPDIINALFTTPEGRGWVNFINSEWDTPLHLAAFKGGPEVIGALLREGALINQVNNNGDTPLHIAALRREPEIVKVLLRGGASVTQVNNNGDTPFHLAVFGGRTEVVKALLAEGPLITQANNRGDTPFHTAARLWRPEILNILIAIPEGRALLSQVNELGDTPLHTAVWNGSPDAVQALIDGGAPLNHANKWGHTPLITTALQSFSKEAANLFDFDKGVALLKGGANFKEDEDWLIISSSKKGTEGDARWYAQALDNLRLIYKYYQLKLTGSLSAKAETKQGQDDTPRISHVDIPSNALNSSLSSPSSSLNTPPETKETKQSETRSVKNISSKAEIRELFDLDSFAGDTAALSEALAVPVEQQSEPLQHYLQSQAIWTVLDSEAKPAHKSAQITLLAEAPGVSLLVENEQGQLPLDVALQQLAEGKINKAAVQKLQDTTQQQRAEEDEEVLQAIEIYVQAAPTAILEEKSSARPGESKSTADAEDGPITLQQLAAETQKYRATEESLQQEFKVLFAPSPPSATPLFSAIKAVVETTTKQPKKCVSKDGASIGF